MVEHQTSTRSLLTDLVNGMSRLVGQEIRLAQAETSEKVSEATEGVVAIGAGVAVAGVALLVLVQALVVALANILPPSIAALVVGVALALLAFGLVQHGKNNLSAQNLSLPRTRATMKTNADMVAEKVR